MLTFCITKAQCEEILRDRKEIWIELAELSRKTGLEGEELALYCEEQGFRKVASLIRSRFFEPRKR